MNTPQNIPSHDAISARARDIWESSGQLEGQDLANWLRAEKEIASETFGSGKGDGDKNGGEETGHVSSPPSAQPSAWPRDRGNQDQAGASKKQPRFKP